MKIPRKKYTNYIDKWWQKGNKEALFVLGTKNVGKTSMVLDWANSAGIKYTYFDEKTYNSIKYMFNSFNLHSPNILISILNKMRINSLNYLIIFDGIKPSDEIIIQMKYLCSNYNHRFILISDYGEYVLENIRFYPVGSINKMSVTPLSFSEFCEFKFNDYMIKSLKTVMFEKENEIYPFANYFEEAWNEYSTYGGFPSVVSELLGSGIYAAEKELKRIKNEITFFVNNNIPFSKNLLTILENFSNERSSLYKRFIFSNLSDSSTYQRYKRPLDILSKLGILGVLPINGDRLNFNYCDIFLCDPGLETIWNEKIDREHVIESALFFHGIRKGFDVNRLILNNDRIIDIVYDTSIPCLIDIKRRNTNSIESSIRKFSIFKDQLKITYKPYILIDKNFNYYKKVDGVSLLPIWAFLLMG